MTPEKETNRKSWFGFRRQIHSSESNSKYSEKSKILSINIETQAKTYK